MVNLEKTVNCHDFLHKISGQKSKGIPSLPQTSKFKDTIELSSEDERIIKSLDGSSVEDNVDDDGIEYRLRSVKKLIMHWKLDLYDVVTFEAKLLNVNGQELEFLDKKKCKLRILSIVKHAYFQLVTKEVVFSDPIVVAFRMKSTPPTS